MNEDELRRELLDAFEAEYREHLGAIRTALNNGPLLGGALRDAFRRAHSLKGAARAVDLPEVEAIAHGLETLLGGAVERGAALPADDVATVRRALDGIEARMRGADGTVAASGPGPEPADGEAPETVRGSAVEGTLRVPAAEVERLAEIVHALSDAVLHPDGGDGTGIAGAAAEVQALLTLWEGSALAAAAVDPALAGFGQRLRRLSRRLSQHPSQGPSQSPGHQGIHEDRARRLAVSLRAQLERITLIEAEGVFGPLAAMARELARDQGGEQGGEVVVHLRGMALRAERRVLQELRDPAIQLLRNAVSHGLRPGGGSARLIELSLALEGGRLLLRVADDGPGPDLVRIERVARERGLLPRLGAADPPDEAALLALVFEPGFSTGAAIDRLSGRGMGLSIVAEAARRLHGTATLRRGAAGGAVVQVAVPVHAQQRTLLLVEAGGVVLGLPGEAVERLLLVEAGAVERPDGDRPLLRTRDPNNGGGTELLPVAWLAPLVGKRVTETGRLAGPLLAAGGRRCMAVVDRLLDVRSLLVRPPDLLGIDRHLVGGVAVDDRGRPVLVLEPPALLDALLSAASSIGASTGGPDGLSAAVATRPAAPATILVVDDSITTRTLEKTILQAHGYRVLVAVDGLAALDVLCTAPGEVDVVVADVEMPRLDGFGLLAAMRDDPRLAGVPTLLMTSRNRQDDIRRGLELGARAHLSKQAFDQATLLGTIAQLLP